MRDRLPRAQRHGAPAAALGLATLSLLAGCGDDSSDGGGATTATPVPEDGTRSVETSPAPSAAAGAARSDESLIRGAITGVFASGNPITACQKYATEKYVAESFGDLDGCTAAIRSGGVAAGVTISEVAVDGDSATAVAVPTGGPSAQEAIDVELVKDGALWKVDSGRSNVPVGP